MTIQAKKWKTGLRGLLLGATVVGVMPMAVGCLDRPVAPSSPRTSNTLTQRVSLTAVDKIDLVFMIDNSSSMADKQKVLADAVPDLLKRLVTPNCLAADGSVAGAADDAGKCQAGSVPEFNAIRDIHIAVVTSSLGGHGADYCSGKPPDNVVNPNDGGKPIVRTVNGGTVPTYDNKGFLAWDPDQKSDPPGENKAQNLTDNFGALVQGANQTGCGFEASLEAWYRFLIDPNPPASVDLNDGNNPLQGAHSTDTDTTLLQQRADFLRPDSLVAIVSLSDENDCSIIDGTMPPDVCEKPTLDASGKPTGCSGGRSAWPANYARGNFQGYTETNGGITGSPFPANNLSGQQNAFPLNGAPFACQDNSGAFCLAPGTEACKTDPDSPDCRSCYLPGAEGCSANDKLTYAQDPTNLRCWNQKQRFGVDMLYPLQRYIDGLSQDTVYDRDGFKVQNPLFDDLPYKAAVASGTTDKLGRSRAEARPSRLVFFAPIVGVPWQDITRNQGDLATDGTTAPDLKAGYIPTVAPADGDDKRTIDWDRILGNPFGYDGKPRVDPADPLMIESNVSTNREGKKQPVTGETINATTWNSVNGHEWFPADNADLQYACIFDLPAPVDCAAGSSDCSTSATSKNPLYENREGKAKDDTSLGTYDAKKQYRAKAYPGTRFLQVAKTFNANVPGNSIVASICTPNLTDKDASDYGYRPAVSAIIDSLKTQLSGQCLPRTLATNGGSAPCLIIDARFRGVGDDGQPIQNVKSDVDNCKACTGGDRKKLDPAVQALLTGDVKDYECLCEITQFTGADLKECQTNTANPLTSVPSSPEKGGWCYVDPNSSDNTDATRAAADEIVKKCPSTQKRTIRFVNTETSNTTLFITCLGAASGNNTVDDGEGAAGTSSGAAGSK